MNLVRIGDVHGSWDRIEPQKGTFRFDVLERFYRRAADYNIRVLLSTGASCPPLWLATEYPDVRIVSNRGETYPMGASYHWACIHHPGFIGAADHYLRELVRFALDQPNHFGWQISNEIGFPFMPTLQPGELELYDYNPYAISQFRRWVRQKYDTLEALNEAWMWSSTALWYNDWEEVHPAEALPIARAGVTRWLDWRAFWQQSFAEFAGHQHRIIRERDADHPTSVNTFNFKTYDRFGTYTGLDQWALAQQVDHIGYDLYPGSGNKLATRPEHNSIFLDHGRSVSLSTGRDFWLHEIESGPIGGWVLGPDYNTSPVDIWRNAIESLGHDAKLMLFMPWREWDSLPIRMGALVDLDGNESDRLKAAVEVGHFIQRHASFLEEAHVPRGDIALLESKANATFFKGVKEEETLFAIQRGVYRGFWELDYTVDFITPAQVADGTLNAYPVVALPLMGLLSLETANALADYVAQGGVLVGFARSGTLTDAGWYHRQLLPGKLNAAFGLHRVEPDSEDGVPISYLGEEYATARKRDLLALADEAEALAMFEDGCPAVTLARYGKGYGVYFATQLDADRLHSEHNLLKDVMDTLLPRLDIEPRVALKYPGRRIRELDAHLLEADSRAMILIANYLKEDTDLKIRVQHAGRSIAGVFRCKDEAEAVNWVYDNDALVLSLQLPKETVEAIQIKWEV